jgi:hypothetical protein
MWRVRGSEGGWVLPGDTCQLRRAGEGEADCIPDLDLPSPGTAQAPLRTRLAEALRGRCHHPGLGGQRIPCLSLLEAQLETEAWGHMLGLAMASTSQSSEGLSPSKTGHDTFTQNYWLVSQLSEFQVQPAQAAGQRKVTDTGGHESWD